MEFVKEFAIFLHQQGIIKFGDFTLASGKKSPYYIDLRIIPSYPHEFRKMVKHLQNTILSQLGLDKFDAVCSIPTGGLVIASALAYELVKPLIYVRSQAKEHGTSKTVEGVIQGGNKVIIVDDVATSGGSLIKGIEELKKNGVVVLDAYVIINRKEGAENALGKYGVKLHSLFDILQIAKILHSEKLLDEQILKKIEKQLLA